MKTEIEIMKLRDNLNEICDDVKFIHERIENAIIDFNKLVNHFYMEIENENR